jgi:ubiquinone/menaquinone biosynthesis C-methylase UbiE
LLIDPSDLELATLRALADFSGQRVVEIGAGDGRLVWPLAPEAAQWVALDPDPEEVIAAAEALKSEWLPPPARLLIADGRALALAGESFDLALFTWSLC